MLHGVPLPRQDPHYTSFLPHFCSLPQNISTACTSRARIVKDTSEHRQEAAGLVAQCLLLKSLLAHHVENLMSAINYAQQALIYSKEAYDRSLQLRALESIALKYAYSKRNQQALQTIEQAIPLLNQKNVPISSQIQALIYGSLACNAARNGQDGTAYLDQAGRLVTKPDAKCPVYLSYEQSYLLFDTGVMYYQQGDSTKALEAFSQLVDPEILTLKTSLDRGEIGRIEAINYMTMASLTSENKDMEQTIHFWTEGIQAARVLHSEQRFAEALAAYDIMRALWPNEQRIQELRDLTRHW
jgi:tetratricopeptide (TPR) repeat protein